MSERWYGWHFLREDGRTGYGKRKPVPGRLMRCRGELVMCENGLHASRRAIDALGHATGSIVQRVNLVGERLDETNKSCARTRRCLWIADAERTLHKFALWCAEGVLEAERQAGRDPDHRSWEALTVKRRWLDGQATDAELEAARYAAWGAAWAAAWEAALAATRYAAWEAAREAALAAARYAAWAATWDAAWDAAREAQTAELERRLMALAPEGYTEEAE